MNKLIKQAFTLIELLVVIAIIGILSGLIVVSMGGMTTKATIAKAQVFSNSLRNSMMMDTVAEFKLDGNANDTWGSIPVGTVTGPTSTTTDCVYGSCYSFNGDDYIDYGDQSALSFTNNVFTFSFWIKRIPSNNNVAVLGKTNTISSPYEYAIRNCGSSLCFDMWTFGGSAVYNTNSAAMEDGWIFFVWTSDGNTSYVYKNGVKGNSQARVGSNYPSDSTASFMIGRGCTGGACYFHNGLLDEIRIYDIAIPISQIQEQYYTGLNNLLANGNITSEEYNQRINSIAGR